MPNDRWSDRDLVLERYAKSASRGTTIFEFRTAMSDNLGHIDWNPAWTVVDAGCGLGTYFPWLQDLVPSGTLVGVDITLVQLYETVRRHPDVPVVQGDIQAVPIADDVIDVVVCAHTLYHVPDIPAALNEFRRILRPGGYLLAIYDSEVDNERELDELFLACGGTVSLNSIANRFSIESGPDYLRSVFDDVRLYTDFPAMLVPEAAPVIDEIDCLRPVAEPYLEPGTTWEDMLARAYQRVVQIIEQNGVFRISEHKGVFICR